MSPSSPRSVDDSVVTSPLRTNTAADASLLKMQRLSKSECDVSTLTKHSEPRKPPKQWTCDDVGAWLDSLGLGEYRSAFMENQIEGSHLLDMDKVLV